MANASFRAVFENGADNEFDLELDDSQGSFPFAETSDAQQSPILVLSRYSALIETVRKAAPRGVPVVQAPDLDQAAGKLRSLKPGVLVADTASTSDIAAMVAQLTPHFPELVIAVAGQREDSAALMQLTASGQIFRFLLVPLSHGQTRLTLEAAIAQHKKLIAPAPQAEPTRGGPSRRKPPKPQKPQKTEAKKPSAAPRAYERNAADVSEKKPNVIVYIAVTAGLAVLLGGAGWFMGRMASQSEAPVAKTDATTAPPTIVIAKPPEPAKPDLTLAQEAFARGDYAEPIGKSALDYYRAVLSSDPDNAAAREGLRNVTAKLLEQAESALLAEQAEDAAKAVELARGIDAQEPRLAFLDAQVARQRERIKVSQSQELRRKVDPLVAKARALTMQGSLTVPNGGSARDLLLEARRLDPTNPVVTQGLRDLYQAMADEAARLSKAGKSDEAQTLLMSAQQLGVSGTPLVAVTSPPPDARNTIPATEPPRPAPFVKTPAKPTTPAAPVKDSGKEAVAEIRRMLSEGKLIEPSGDNAKNALATLRATDPTRAELNELASALSAKLLESGKQALAAKAFDRSQQLLTAARDVGAANESAISEVERELLAARNDNGNATSSDASNIVPASSLRRIKMVEPIYPPAARRRNEKGLVELLFTVTPDGRVADVEVRKSNPARVFDDAAIKALEQWQFEPVKVDGQAVSQRAVVRLQFSMD
jgi:TonB family protein